MILHSITELSLMGIFDRGIPNSERIAFQATERISLGHFGILLGIKGVPGAAFPIRDNFFWFQDGILNPHDWVLVYTCNGKPTGSVIPNTETHLYTVFWGRPGVILANPNIVPILFRMDAVAVGEQPLMLPNSG